MFLEIFWQNLPSFPGFFVEICHFFTVFCENLPFFSQSLVKFMFVLWSIDRIWVCLTIICQNWCLFHNRLMKINFFKRFFAEICVFSHEKMFESCGHFFKLISLVQTKIVCKTFSLFATMLPYPRVSAIGSRTSIKHHKNMIVFPNTTWLWLYN